MRCARWFGMGSSRSIPTWKRSKRATLTPAGRSLMQQAISRWADANGRIETTLGPTVAGNLRALADLISSERFLAAYHSGLPLEP